jgi:hypothetical protein
LVDTSIAFIRAAGILTSTLAMFALRTLLAFTAAISIASAHTVITYPGWRGNNLHTNGTVPEHNPQAIGVDYSDNGTLSYPWGMQWIYPCKHSQHLRHQQ